MAPDEWLNTPTYSPTAMSSTIKTLLHVACGSLEVDVRNDITSAGDLDDFIDRAFCKRLKAYCSDRKIENALYVTVAIRLEIYGFGNSEEASMARKMQQSDGGNPMVEYLRRMDDNPNR